MLTSTIVKFHMIFITNLESETKYVFKTMLYSIWKQSDVINNHRQFDSSLGLCGKNAFMLTAMLTSDI